MVFSDVYEQSHLDYNGKLIIDFRNMYLVGIEYFIDVIYCIEIIFNFLKRTHTNRDLKKIAN